MERLGNYGKIDQREGRGLEKVGRVIDGEVIKDWEGGVPARAKLLTSSTRAS